MPARGRDQRTGCCTELQRDMGGRMAGVCCQSWARAALNAPKETPVCDTGVPCPSFHPLHPGMGLWCAAFSGFPLLAGDMPEHPGQFPLKTPSDFFFPPSKF